MGRLTDSSWCCGWFCGGFGACDDDTCEAHMAWERLRQYEDSGLTPEMCKRFGDAEREGRYIMLQKPALAGVHRLQDLARAAIEGRVQILPKEDANAAHNI